MSVLTSIWILYLHHKDGSTSVPHCVKVFAFKGLAYILCMQASVPPVRKKKVAPKPTMINVDEESNGPRSPGVMSSSPDLISILDNLTFITDKLKEQDEEAIVIAEWRAVAKILDRFLFWASTFAIILIFVILISRQDLEH